MNEVIPIAQDCSLPQELLDLEEVQFDLVHDYQRAARNLLQDMIARLEKSVQFGPEFRSEVVRQLELAIRFLSGDHRDPQRAARRVHRVMKAIWTLVRSNYTASFEDCFPPEAVHVTVRQDDRIVSDHDIPPDP